MADPNPTALTIVGRLQRGPHSYAHGQQSSRTTTDERPGGSGVRFIVIRPVRDDTAPSEPRTIPTPNEDRQESLEALRAFSTRLLVNHPQHRSRKAEEAFVELGTCLSLMVGRDGYRALVTRALDLAAAEFPHLSAVRPASSTPGRLVGLHRVTRSPAAVNEEPALAATLAALLWLLDQFIGEDLAQALVREVWPWLADCGDMCQP